MYGLSGDIWEFPWEFRGFHTRRHREMGALPGSQIRGREDREFLLQAIWDSMGVLQKTHGFRWLVSSGTEFT